MNTQTGTYKLRLQATIFAQFVLLCARYSNVSHLDGVFFTYADGGTCWPTHDL